MTYNEENFSTAQSQSRFQQKILRGLKMTIAVGGIALWGFGFYQGIEQALRGQSVFDNYENNCQVHLQRATNAAMIAPAKEELADSMPWLENNYAKDTFEYRNLKADLQYLQKQEPELLIPDSIKNSIDQTSKTINETQKTKLHNSSSLFFLMLFTPVLICLILVGLYFMEFGRFYL